MKLSFLTVAIFIFFCFQIVDESENRRSPFEDDGDEQEDDNDTNITDDEDNGGDKPIEVR